MRNKPILKTRVDVSLHKPSLIEASMNRMVRLKDLRCATENPCDSFMAISMMSAEYKVQGNFYVGTEQVQFRIPYKSVFMFTWVKSSQKNRMEWGISLS
ncbi:MAG: hypothetical protein ABIT96_01285 [Ferruginibacter sp.]